MRLSERDKAVIADLNRFRCMCRDDIAAIHYGKLKDPIKAANTALLRLYRQGLIERSNNFEPYVYFPAGSTMKKNSQKIPHFMELTGVYRDLLTYEPPSIFSIEPKYSKGLAEPDIFTVFKRSPIFIEVQRSVYSAKVMDDKIARYEALYASKLLDKEPWQLPDRPPVFPAVLLLSSTRYAVKSDNFPIIQAESVADFMRQMGGPRVVPSQKTEKKAPIIIIKPNKKAQ